MAYLLDTNVFIPAKNEYFDFEICPGFWAWLLQSHQRGRVFSIDHVRTELLRGQDGQDPLTDWARARNKRFFVKQDDDVTRAMRRVAQWAQRHSSPEARDKFLGSADAALVAFGLAAGNTVVTHERSRPGKTTNVKIPDACAAMGVAVVSAKEMLLAEKASFVLATG
jgi:hypothetical protein